MCAALAMTLVVILAYRKLNDAREASLAATSDSRWRFGNRIVIEDYGKADAEQEALVKAIWEETSVAAFEGEGLHISDKKNVNHYMP